MASKPDWDLVNENSNPEINEKRMRIIENTYLRAKAEGDEAECRQYIAEALGFKEMRDEDNLKKSFLRMIEKMRGRLTTH